MPKLSPQSFDEHLRTRRLLAPGEKIFVACSGGPDSTALFHLLISIRKAWKLKLGLLHFNHGLRAKASVADERFVKNLAKKCGVPFYSGRMKVADFAGREKFSTEEAARIARYDFFQKIAKQKKIQKIMTAHTLDDQAETVLMRVLQGTGLRGLCGIRENIRFGNVYFARPFLGFRKEHILQYLKENKLNFRTDTSNASQAFLRNRIRLKLIPFIAKAFQPQAAEAIARIPFILREEAQCLEDLAEQSWTRVFISHRPRNLFFRRNLFLKLPPAIQFRLLDRGLRQMDVKSGLSFEAWQKLRLLFTRSHARYSLPKDIDFILTPFKITLYKK